MCRKTGWGGGGHSTKIIINAYLNTPSISNHYKKHYHVFDLHTYDELLLNLLGENFTGHIYQYLCALLYKYQLNPVECQGA